MIEVTSFGTVDEVFTQMQEAEEAANAQLFPAQMRLRDDRDVERYWFRPFEDFDIWGAAWTDAMCHASSIKAGCTPEEAADETTALIEARLRGYVFGRAYSLIEPMGEIGSTHVSQIVPITVEMFSAARETGWESKRDIDLAHLIRTKINEMLQEDRHG